MCKNNVLLKKPKRSKGEGLIRGLKYKYKSDYQLLFFKVISQAWDDAFYKGTNTSIDYKKIKNNSLKFFGHPKAYHGLFDEKKEWEESREILCRVCDLNPNKLKDNFIYWYNNKKKYYNLIQRYREGDLNVNYKIIHD